MNLSVAKTFNANMVPANRKWISNY